MYGGQVRLNAGLPFVSSVMGGNAALEIFLAKAAILKGDDWRGKWIRCEAVRIIAHHQPQVAQHVRRKDVLIRQDSHGVKIGAILALAGCLL